MTWSGRRKLMIESRADEAPIPGTEAGRWGIMTYVAMTAPRCRDPLEHMPCSAALFTDPFFISGTENHLGPVHDLGLDLDAGTADYLTLLS